MLKRWIGLLAVVWLMACGGSETSSTSAGGAGGTGGTGGGGTTITGLGGTGGETTSEMGGTAGGGGVTCKVPQPFECGPTDPGTALYDPLLSYNTGSSIFGYVTAIPGTPEVGAAAAGALLGPWKTDKTFAGMSLVMRRIGASLPDPVTLAVWSEELCGLPVDDPHLHEVDVPLANFTIEDLSAGFYRLTWMFDEPVTVPAGALVATSLSMVDLTVAIAAYVPAVPGEALFSVWWGIVDNDCDGQVDPDLGWATLTTPTAEDVTPYPYDEAFGLIEAPPAPAPLPIINGDCCPRGCKCPR